MCVYSMVLDHYQPLIPQPWGPNIPDILPQPEYQPPEFNPNGFTFTSLPNFQVISPAEIEAIRKLIAEFKEALEAAKVIDRLTKQPDCEDPEKKKLEERVALLEKQIAFLLGSK